MLKIRNLSLPPRLFPLDLDLPKGKIYGIIGPNGAGKTTFLRALKRLETPKTGQVYWEGEEISSLSSRPLSKLITLVPQNPHIAFAFTVREFIEMGRYGIGSPNPALLEELLIELDLLHLAETPITLISGGERQRAYIARSLMTEAPILLLDEPMANLDIRHQNQLWRLLQTLKKKGQTTLLAVHDLRGALAYSDDLILLNQGKLVTFGSISDSFLFDVFGIESMEVHPF